MPRYVSPPLAAAAAVLACACGCEMFQKTDLDADFLKVLRFYKGTKPEPDEPELSAEQKALKNRLEIVRIARPEAFEDITVQVRLLESRNNRVRHDAMVRLGGAGEAAADYIAFAFTFFSVDEPSGFDNFLLDPDDPAVFHLLGETASSGTGSQQAEKALSLIAPFKARAMFALGERGSDAGWREIVFKAASLGRAAVPALDTIASSPGRPWFTRLKAIEALGLAGGPDSQAALLRIARAVSGSSAEEAKLACLAAAARQAGPGLPKRLRDFVGVSDGSARLEAAFLLARFSTDRSDFLDLARSPDPGVSAAAVMGLARLGAEVGAICDSLPRSGPAASKIIAFLYDYSWLAPVFAKWVISLSVEGPFARAAVPLLPCTGSAEAESLLLKLVESGPDQCGIEALEASAVLFSAGKRPAALVEAVRKRMASAVEREARAALRAARAASDAAARPEIMACMARHPDLGGECVFTLASGAGPAGLSDIPLEVFIKNLHCRAAAIEVLVKAGEVGAWKYALGLSGLSTPEHAARGLRVIAAAGGEENLKHVFSVLSAQTPELLACALDAMAALDPEKATPVILDYLDAGSTEALVAAMRALLRCRTPLDSVRDALDFSEAQDRGIRRAAIDLIAGKGNGEEAAARLKMAVLEGDPEVKISALRGLARMAAEDSSRFIEAAIRDASPSVRAAAASAAATLRLDGLAPVIEDLAGDSDARARIAAAAALAAMGRPEKAEAAARALAAGHAGLSSGFPRWEALSVLSRHDEAARAVEADLAGPDEELAMAFVKHAAGDEEAAWEHIRSYSSAVPGILEISSIPLVASMASAEGGRARLRAILAPAECARHFLHRLFGPVVVILSNGAFIKGDLIGFEHEEVVIAVASGQVRLHRGQLKSIVRPDDK